MVELIFFVELWRLFAYLKKMLYLCADFYNFLITEHDVHLNGRFNLPTENLQIQQEKAKKKSTLKTTVLATALE